MRDTHINEKGGMAKRRRSLTHDNVTPFAVAGEKSSASRGAQDGMGREQEEMKEGKKVVGGGKVQSTVSNMNTRQRKS